jgi:hypothetical protein
MSEECGFRNRYELLTEIESMLQQLAECERERDLYLEEMHHYQQQLISVSNDAERYKVALEKIANWELPVCNETYPDGSPISFTANYGSQGAKAHIRKIAAEALAKVGAGKTGEGS